MSIDRHDLVSRRHWLHSTGAGFGSLALSWLLARDGHASDADDPITRTAGFAVWNLTSSGSSRTQGLHHEAQKLTTTQRPL